MGSTRAASTPTNHTATTLRRPSPPISISTGNESWTFLGSKTGCDGVRLETPNRPQRVVAPRATPIQGGHGAMKALNNSDNFWTNLSVKEVEISEYQAACCLNVRINRQAQVSCDPEIT